MTRMEYEREIVKMTCDFACKRFGIEMKDLLLSQRRECSNARQFAFHYLHYWHGFSTAVIAGCFLRTTRSVLWVIAKAKTFMSLYDDYKANYDDFERKATDFMLDF